MPWTIETVSHTVRFYILQCNYCFLGKRIRKYCTQKINILKKHQNIMFAPTCFTNTNGHRCIYTNNGEFASCFRTSASYTCINNVITEGKLFLFLLGYYKVEFPKSPTERTESESRMVLYVCTSHSLFEHPEYYDSPDRRLVGKNPVFYSRKAGSVSI